MPKRNGATRRARKRARKEKSIGSMRQQRLSKKSIDDLAWEIAKAITNNSPDPDDNIRCFCPTCNMGYCKMIGINKNSYCHECIYKDGCIKDVQKIKQCVFCRGGKQ